MDWVFGFFLLSVDLNISNCFVWLLQNTVNFPYRLGSLKSWVSDLFQKRRCCFWHPGEFWWHTVEFRCHLNCSMQDWQFSACGEIMQDLCGTVAVSHAVHFGTRRSVQPVWEPGASWCAVSGGNPVKTFPSNLLKLCDVCSAACSRGGDGWKPSSWTYQ